MSRLCLFVGCFIQLLLAVRSDTPGNCTYEEIEGIWEFSIAEKITQSFTDCSQSGEIKEKLIIKLLYPDIATDNFGNIGFWSLIYNQGFEVVIHGRKYFAYSKYDQNGTSFCDETMPGWSHDVLGHKWVCFYGKKPTSHATIKHSVAPLWSPQAEHLLHAPSSQFIDDINKNAKTWRAVQYPQHKYHTIGDMVRMAGGKRSRIANRPSAARATAEHEKLAGDLPSSFDWRHVDGVNLVSPVRNQGSCGSCYSFASLAMLEARFRILTNLTLQPVFAPQDVVECSHYSQGCEGGFAYLIAGKYAEDFGVVEESCNPYQGKDANCSTAQSCERFYATGYKYVGGYYGGCSDKAMQLALFHNGPVAIGFEVTKDFFQYKGGIYQNPTLSDSYSKFNPFEMTNHAVLLVGWGEEDGIPYWSVKNSWGTNWGEDGYFRIIRGRDELGIESMALESFPIL